MIQWLLGTEENREPSSHSYYFCDPNYPFNMKGHIYIRLKLEFITVHKRDISLLSIHLYRIFKSIFINKLALFSPFAIYACKNTIKVNKMLPMKILIYPGHDIQYLVELNQRQLDI
ncbi:hypothetical protein XELAEV_18039414mg [Xenopus laevis]|uniref:Uncharacterized protein n=1 Tax=Xenopus laevis TaxID=8355 RepID=A0A974H7X6_XENLA|nr:hypothetical protein XELAEV_18039414mg [Xenopus laevis]